MPGVILLNPITGTVNLSEPITGTVGLSGPITGAVRITEPVQVFGTVAAAFSGTIGTVAQGTSGSTAWKVEVENFPLTSSVTGNVGITNFPSGFNVAVTASVPLTASVTGNVGISGPITGTVGLSGPVTGAVKLTEPVAVSNFPTGFNVSVTSSVPLSATVVFPAVQTVTGSVGLSGPVTGAVKLTEPVVVSNFPTGFNVAITSSVALTASVTGNVGLTGPITGTVGLSGPVTGAVKLTEAAAVLQHAVTISGSVPLIVTGSMTGTVGLSGPITGAVKLTEVAKITGSVSITEAVTVQGAGAVSSRAGFCFGKMDTSVGGEQIIEHTVYTEMTGNFRVALVSVSGTDTVAAGGTGARTVRVTYFDLTGSGPFTEVVQMSGTTPVPLSASSTCFIEKMEVLTVGSYGTNKGTISLKLGVTGAGGTVGSMLGNNGRTYWAHHYVPSGTTCFITGMYGAHFNNTSQSSGGTFFIRQKSLDISDAANIQVTDYLNAYGQSSAPVRTYGTPIEVMGPSRLSMYVFPDGALTETFIGSFDFYEQDQN